MGVGNLSTLSRMAKTLNKSDISTEEYLSQIHASLLNQIKKRKISTEDAQALKIQTFLRQIKYLQKYGQFKDGSIDFSNSGNFPFSTMWSKMEQQALMNALYQAHPQLFEYGLFYQKSDISYELGQYLESGLTQVLNTFESAVTQRSYQDVKKTEYSKRKIGGQHVQIPDLIGVADSIMKEEFNSLYIQTQKELKKYRGDQSNVATFMPSVEGKIDISGYTATLTISNQAILSPYTKSILNALKNATFTAKNYISTKELKFGQTNPFRVFMTVAPGGSESIGRFQRMINCFEEHGNSIHPNGPQLFYRIRAIYELTGIGMQYTNNEFTNKIFGNGAKFLVWNNPIGDQIYVIPTQKIVDELIENVVEDSLPKNWKDALFGVITLPQVDIAKLAH